uniref:Uncharacterized protein n=1 Tax=Romanomermis culicivorax TaxID=13658 RepID=A0A915K229_ROMCU
MDLKLRVPKEIERMKKGNIQDVATLAILESIHQRVEKSTNVVNAEPAKATLWEQDRLDQMMHERAEQMCWRSSFMNWNSRRQGR